MLLEPPSTSSGSKRTLGRRRGALDLVPGDRRRAPSALPGAQGVDRDGRLVRVVLAPVDEHLALRSAFFIRETTSSGSCFSSRSRQRWANGLVWSYVAAC